MEQKVGVKESFSIIKRIWDYAEKWKIAFFLAFLGGSTAPLFYSYMNSYLYQLFVNLCKNQNKEPIYNHMKVLGIFLILGVIFYGVCFGVIFIINARVKGAARKAIYRHTQKLTEEYLNSKHSGDIATRVTKDFNDAMELTGYTLAGYENPFAMLITIAGTFFIICYRSWILGLISLILSCINLAVINRYIKPLQLKEKKVKEASSEAAQEIVNTLSGMGISRIFGFQQMLKQEYEKKANDIYTSNISVIRKRTNIHLTTDMQSIFSSAGVMLVGLYLALKGQLDIATVVFIVNMQTTLSSTTARFGDRIAGCQKNIVSGKRLIEYIETPEEEERENRKNPDSKAEYAIEMQNVQFQYKQAEKKLFDNVSLMVKRGENIALVGGSGGGKSTIFKLIMEFEQKDAGSIRLMGNDLEEYSYEVVRGMFSYVPQDCYLFDGTIRENILLGNPCATEAVLQDVIEKAYLKELVDELHDGYNTEIGEGGCKLSGGQRQRIAIARAMIKDAPIILLDEATSSLDSNSEEEVKHAFEELMKGKTCITIAHRISTIKNANRILVLEGGKIVEQGTHNSLIKQNGRYAKLYNMQFV